MERQMLANKADQGEMNMQDVMKIFTHEEAVGHAKGLFDSIRSRAKQSEELRHQPPETIQEILSSGLVRVLIPQRWGGHELSWKTLVDTAIEISKADPSAGWCYSLLLLHNWMLAFWPDQAQADVWRDNPDACIATSINSGPTSQITRGEGGYRLSGKWGFSSGINHCDWVMVGMEVPHPSNEQKKKSYFLLPKSDLQVLDVWHVIGMRGTGSNVLELKDVFVPDHRIVEIEPWNFQGISPGMELNTAPLYQIQLSAIMPVTLLSVILGSTMGAYELWRDTVLGKNKSKSGNRVAELTHQQIRLAKVATKIEAANALLRKSLEAAESGTLDYAQRVRLRCNYAYCVELCVEAMETIFMSSGAAVSAETNLLQLFWRDIHAASMHAAFNFDWLGEILGKIEFGLPVKMEY
jgi:3-hydroxy-9,10-secoandrosta-1,3,5(10)-triene-9,17-dione monooxygenase